MRSGVVCAGVSCIDLFLYGTEPLATRESLCKVQRVQYRPGGATSNTGRALARLGVPVELMTVVGHDSNGDMLLKLWEQEGIGTGHVTRSREIDTAMSAVPVYGDGKRGVYFYPGTNDILRFENMFGPESTYLPLLQNKQAFHFGYPPLTPRLQGSDLRTLLAAVRDQGVLVSIDTTPIPDDTSLRLMLESSLPLAHLFAPNIEEASQLVGRFGQLYRRACASGTDQTEIEDIITLDELVEIGEEVLALGVPLVIITLGANGTFVCTGDQTALQQTPLLPTDLTGWRRQRLYIPAYAVEGPINSAGAGDTFVAAILAGLCARVDSMQTLVKVAQCASALHVGTTGQLCGINQTLSLLQDMPTKTPKNPQLPRECMVL